MLISVDKQSYKKSNINYWYGRYIALACHLYWGGLVIYVRRTAWMQRGFVPRWGQQLAWTGFPA